MSRTNEQIMADFVNKSRSELLKSEKTREELTKLVQTGDLDGLDAFLSQEEGKLHQTIEAQNVRLHEAMNACNRITEKADKVRAEVKTRQVEREERRKELEELDQLNNKLSKSMDMFQIKIDEMKKQDQIRRETVLAYLEDKKVNTNIGEENPILDYLHEYLQAGKDMPSANILNHLGVHLRPKVSLKIFLDPFFLFAVQKATEEALKEYERDEDMEILDNAMNLSKSIRSFKDILNDLVIVQDGKRTLPGDAATALGLENVQEEVDGFYELFEKVREINSPLTSKIGNFVEHFDKC